MLIRRMKHRFHPPPEREARAVPSAFVGEGASLCSAKGIYVATGRKRLGRGVSKVDWTIVVDFVRNPER